VASRSGERLDRDRRSRAREIQLLQRAIGNHGVSAMLARHGAGTAAGRRSVARVAATDAELIAADLATDDESFDPLEWLDELLAAADEGSSEGEVEGAPQSVATLRRMPVARKPATARRRVVPLTSDDISDLKRVGTRTVRELATLEQERAITTAEAEKFKSGIEDLMGRSKAGRGDREALTKQLNRLRALPEWARKRAAALRSTKDKKLVSDFKLEPPVIRVSEHESARISFVVKGTPKSIDAYILSDPDREGTSYKIFHLDAKSGYHQLIWDGTFEGERSRPPEPGVYRIEISITDEDGKSERLHDQIRVENPDSETVLPRVASGLAISTLHFDGKTFTLIDERGNSIEVPATSGLKPNNPKNKDKVDYTDPKYEWEKGKGPIPHGTYTVSPGQFQLPDANQRGTKYASGGTATHWGPMRVHILPNAVQNRSEFFLHLDVGNDGTAGCIGFPPSEQGKFNQIMSLIATSKKDVKLVVAY
jgi:hypothetical protein